MNEQRITLTDRIAYAEDWLDRARRRLNDGEVAEGALALVLAEAELQRAREANGAGCVTAGAGPRKSWIAWTALGTLGLAAAVAVATVVLLHPSLPGDPSDAAPVVRLSAATGEMLHLVTPPEPAVERTVVEPRVVHVRVPVPVPVAVPVVTAQPVVPVVKAPAPVRPEPATARADAPPVPAPAVAPASTPPVATLSLTDAEVIDMVLAAERSLRRTGNQ
ncbi:MAG: hypothetical protein QN178_07900 [Armatimonadota bacterium]|nr:hypothetical protein [Armatimonadota bacterium]